VMYSKPFYCHECQRKRWPGDCVHKQSVSATVTNMERKNCPTCELPRSGCTCFEKARIQRGFVRRVESGPYANDWCPDMTHFRQLMLALRNVADDTKRDIYLSTSEEGWVCVGKWLTFFSPKFALLNRLDLEHQYEVLFKDPVKLERMKNYLEMHTIMPALNMGSYTSDEGMELQGFTSSFRDEGAPKVLVNAHALPLLKGLKLELCLPKDNSDVDSIVGSQYGKPRAIIVVRKETPDEVKVVESAV